MVTSTATASCYPWVLQLPDELEAPESVPQRVSRALPRRARADERVADGLEPQKDRLAAPRDRAGQWK